MALFKNIFGKNDKEKLDAGMEKTKESFLSKITKSVAGKSTIDDEVLDNLENDLISADVGVDTTLDIIHRIQKRISVDKYLNINELNNLLKDEIKQILTDSPNDNYKIFDLSAHTTPYILLVVGVNGVGKTTTIGKIAAKYKEAGNKVILGAADTFRAAAIDQLTIWSDRLEIPIIKQSMGSDPASVAFDTVKSAISQGADIAIIDTAGRLHNKIHLMDELNKIKRVIQKAIPDAPHEVMLVLDGSTGQNALEQAKQFMNVTDINSLTITKLDGTAKGGIVLAIANQLKIQVKYIGVGEKIDDLLIFDKNNFVDSIIKI